MRGEFRPLDPMFARETHDVIIGGVRRDDYRIERDVEGQIILLDGLTYDETCNVQIIPKTDTALTSSCAPHS